MCLTRSKLVVSPKWNWEGDRIIHECIVPSSRPAVGSDQSYDIDVREFLITERNEVMRRTLNTHVRHFVSSLGARAWERFTSRAPGAFDYRADTLPAFVGAHIRYTRRGPRDPWQFPDETLVLRAGDCEDRALLLASLLLASGISGYNVRVALGVVRLHPLEGEPTDHDHSWVMYKDEEGRWRVLEPLLEVPSDAEEPPTQRGAQPMPLAAEYRPSFLFNDAHLWEVFGREPGQSLQEKLSLERRWSKLDPTFAGSVHRTILNEALRGVAPPSFVAAINSTFRRALGGLIGPWVDDVDRPENPYDPIQHFDNGCIPQGWQQVKSWLASFQQDSTQLDSFARAAHAIADFYAHSSYVHFAKFVNNEPVLYDPDDEASVLETPPDYSSGPFNLGSGQFSVHPHLLANDSRATIPDEWRGKLISGRYALPKDKLKGQPLLNAHFEHGTAFPKHDVGLSLDAMMSLPHHEEIAVDEKLRGPVHKLYADNHANPRLVYENQFEWRRGAATRHIRQAFQRHWSGGL
jgi:hypothetical protein